MESDVLKMKFMDTNKFEELIKEVFVPRKILSARHQVITLTVKVAELYKMANPEQHKIDRLCELKDLDHKSSSQNAPLKDFESQVFLNFYVEWVAETTDQDYQVVIDSISYKLDFFESTITRDPKEEQSFRVRVKDDGNLIGKYYDYKINFSIYELGSDPKSFKIDPKLCANN